MSSPVYSEFSFVPASAYAANINILPELREAIKNAFPALDWRGSEAEILEIEMQSAAEFTAKINRETQLTAKSAGMSATDDGSGNITLSNGGSGYAVRYRGPVEYVVFSAEATLTNVHIRWAMQNKTHAVAQITSVSGAKLTRGGFEVPAAAGGKYELCIGGYFLTANGVTTGFFYNLENALTVRTSIESAAVVLGAALTYTGNEQEKAVTSVTLGGVKLTENTDYTVSGDKGTDAGNYSLRIDGIGNYAGTIIAPWTIAKAAAGLSVSPEAIEMSVSGSDTITISTNSDGKIDIEARTPDVVELSVGDESHKITVTAIAAGECVLDIQQEEDKNHLAGTAECTVTVTA